MGHELAWTGCPACRSIRIAGWHRGLGLGQYEASLRENEIDVRQGAIATVDASFVAEVNRVAKRCPPADLCRKAKEAVMTDNPAVPEIPVLRDNRGLFYGWFVVAAAFAVTFVGFGCTYSFSAFIESLQRDFGASRGSVSLVFALTGFLYFCVGSISGPLADRFGSRRLALIGMILIGAGLVAASVAQSLLQVYAAYGLGIGLGVGCSYVPAVGAVPRWFARRKVRNSASQIVPGDRVMENIVIANPIDPSVSGGAVANSPPKAPIPPIRQRIRGPFTRYPVVNGPMSRLAKPTVPARPRTEGRWPGRSD